MKLLLPDSTRDVDLGGTYIPTENVVQLLCPGPHGDAPEAVAVEKAFIKERIRWEAACGAAQTGDGGTEARAEDA